MKWVKLSEDFQKKCADEKEKYYSNIVSDLKTSNISQWYSKVKRMTGQDQHASNDVTVEALIGLLVEDQAEKIADHYASVSNL